MKLCILGPEKRGKTELSLIDRGKKVFDSILYVPYTEIGVSSEKVEYKVDISSFDAVLPRIERANSLFAYIVLNNLSTLYSPISPNAYLATHDRFLMLEYFKSVGIEIPKIYLINSRKSLSRLKDLKLPLAIMSRGSENIMFATNKTELKTMVDAIGFKHPVYLEEFYPAKYIQAIVIGREVFCIERKPASKKDIYFGEGKMSTCKLSESVRDLALKVSDKLNVDFACITIVKNKVFDVNFVPPLHSISEVLGEDLIYKLLRFVRFSIKRKEVPLLDKLLYDAKRILKEIFES